MGITSDSMIQKIENSRLWYWIDQAWLWLIPFVGTIICALGNSSLFLLTVLLSGVICVVLAARGSIWTYPIGLYNSVAYAFVAWNDKLYGEVMLNLLFFVPMNVVGILLWRKKMSQGRVSMRGLSWFHRLLVAFLVVATTAVGGLALAQIRGQNTPFLDAFTNVVSIAATFLMVWRYKEQWLLYVILNVATILMWAIRLDHGSDAGWTMVAMWSLFLVNACYGYMKWSLGAHADARKSSGTLLEQQSLTQPSSTTP